VNSYRLDDFKIILGKKGVRRYTKASYPVRHGVFNEIKSQDYCFQFNLSGEIKYIQGLDGSWPHPAEWLKRTDGHDWVYYSIAGYHQILDTLGEYYLPCLPYPSNSAWTYNPFNNGAIVDALAAFERLIPRLKGLFDDSLPAELKGFLDTVIHSDSAVLYRKAEILRDIIGGRVTVLPPDTRHVDYEVIPLTLSDGCLFHCGFCSVKSGNAYRNRSKSNIRSQIKRLKSLYGANLLNFNALFLGSHDALAAGADRICRAAEDAYEEFEFQRSHVSPPALYLFGSADSLLRADEQLLDILDRGPYQTYINIGLESADSGTLNQLGKPLNPHRIEEAFQKMLEINRTRFKVEITANFLIGDSLTADHYHSLVNLIHDRLPRYHSKGGIYLSPLDTSCDYRKLLLTFFKIKSLSRLPAFLYLIQRL
jgi:hypothetical protein